MTVNLHVHGTTVSVRSPKIDFLRFVERNYSSFLCSQGLPEVCVSFSRDSGEYARKLGRTLPRYGENLFATSDALYWRNEFGFDTLVQVLDGAVNVFAYHSGLDRELGSEAQLRNLQRSMRWTVHFPLFALQRRDRNRHLTHAAAVANSDGAWVFAGLNGVGKSTLAAGLLDQNGWRHISDNFLLGDDTLIYPFPETLRLSDESLRATLDKSIAPPELSVYGKQHVRAYQSADPVVPHVGFLVTNTARLTLEPIDSMRAILILRSLHDRLQEFPEYGHFAALPVLDRFADGPVPKVPGSLGLIKWYRLGLPLDWRVKPALERILECG